ncbi:hypothetical protein DL96DRAFT_1666532 [Flagelloscypha sp. PMI_526]|nr:hypothetical protein DL96DRAFT_1666532 [Flagelloscypha sp. PMI_526]
MISFAKAVLKVLVSSLHSCQTGTLQMCNTVPDQPDPIAAQQCRVIWDGTPKENWIAGEGKPAPASTSSTASADPSLTSALQNKLVSPTRAVTSTVYRFCRPYLLSTMLLPLTSAVTSVTITGMGYDDTAAVLDNLHNTKREDLTFICFQVWVLGMSVVALLRTFKRVISQGACDGTNLLSSYWNDRAMAEIPGLALNGLGLLLSSFLTYKLFKLFGWQTFKRVGASLTINRLYKVVLSLSITIQLAVFFVAVAVALWLDQLFNTNLGRQATFKIGYKIASIIILVALIPWLILGWVSVRKEHKISMYLFLAISIIYLAGWGSMFFSWTFQWEFKTWAFFSVMSILSVALTFASLVLGFISFFNFGKGLPRYLEAQEELPGDDFPPDPEKVAFPTNGPIPTFSCCLWIRNEVRQVGPRFFRSSEPFESSSEDRTTIASGGDLERVKSNASESSIGSYYSYSGRSEATQTTKNTRWVIE